MKLQMGIAMHLMDRDEQPVLPTLCPRRVERESMIGPCETKPNPSSIQTGRFLSRRPIRLGGWELKRESALDPRRVGPAARYDLSIA